LQLTAGIFGFNNVFGFVVGFGLSDVFRQTPAATELLSLDGAGALKLESADIDDE